MTSTYQSRGPSKIWHAPTWADLIALTTAQCVVGDRCWYGEGALWLRRLTVGVNQRWVPDDTKRFGRNSATSVPFGSIDTEGVWSVNASVASVAKASLIPYDVLGLVIDTTAGAITIACATTGTVPYQLRARGASVRVTGANGASISLDGAGAETLFSPLPYLILGGQTIHIGLGGSGGGGGGNDPAFGNAGQDGSTDSVPYAGQAETWGRASQPSIPAYGVGGAPGYNGTAGATARAWYQTVNAPQMLVSEYAFRGRSGWDGGSGGLASGAIGAGGTGKTSGGVALISCGCMSLASALTIYCNGIAGGNGGNGGEIRGGGGGAGGACGGVAACGYVSKIGAGALTVSAVGGSGGTGGAGVVPSAAGGAGGAGSDGYFDARMY